MTDKLASISENTMKWELQIYIPPAYALERSDRNNIILILEFRSIERVMPLYLLEASVTGFNGRNSSPCSTTIEEMLFFVSCVVRIGTT
jgi:hypothetical protein